MFYDFNVNLFVLHNLKPFTFYKMAETGTAVPSNVNLARQKPYAVSAYSRRVKSLANNAQTFGPDSYVNITLDTSTPGSFLDPLQSYLKFDLTIQNSNIFADYVSFGPAGAASIIEEFRIYVQGTPIEEILQYNVFYEMAMNQNGQCQQPYYLYKANPMELGVSSIFHQNAIKPPMIDNLGRPMYGSTASKGPKTGFGPQGCSWAYAANGGNLTDLRLVASQAPGTNKVCFSGCRPFFDTVAEGVLNKIGANDEISGANLTVVVPLMTMDPHSLLFGQASIDRTNDGPTAARSGARAAASTFASASVFPGTFQLNDGTYVNQTLSANVEGERPFLEDNNGQVGMDSYVANYILPTNIAAAGISTVASSYAMTAEGGILPFSGTTVEIPSCYGASEVDVNPDFDPYNPLNWHTLLPPQATRPDVRTLGPDNLQDYFMFLANTKLIPIGTPGWDKYSAQNAANGFSNDSGPPANGNYKTSVNFKNFDQYQGNLHTTSATYTCCIPLISGVLGSFADKCWPTMLVAPGSMYIQIRTASAAKAFQISMDPCRRVLGTVRDYLPFGGSMGGLYGQFGGVSTPATTVGGNLGQQSTSFTPVSGAVSSLYGFLPRETMTDYRAPAYFTILNDTALTPAQQVISPPGTVTTRQAVKVTQSDKEINSMINGYACIGASLTSANTRLAIKYFNGDDGFGLPFRPYSVAAMNGQWTIGRSYISQFTGNSTDTFMQITEESSRVGQYNNLYASGMQPMFSGMNSSFTAPDGVTAITSNQVRRPLIATTATNTNLLTQFTVGAYSNANNNGASPGGGFYANQMPQADVTTEFHVSGIPLPQYILVNEPWLRKTFAYDIDVNGKYLFYGVGTGNLGSEQIACYGTYLSASVPQSRRVLQSNGASNNGSITYQLQNIEFVSQQIILPDSVSASILEDAANGDISLNANSIHNYQTPCGVSTSQNLIIPAKIASANTMYCLFVPQAFVSGNAASVYNSLRGINPFASVAVDGQLSGIQTPYSNLNGIGFNAGSVEIRNTPCRSGAFQVQLKVGNELIPQQPLTTITELVSENVKAQHKLFDTQSNVNTTFSITTTASEILGGNITSGLSFDSITTGHFTTTFVAADLLDDQTAISNPSMGYVYACEGSQLASGGANIANTTIDSYVIKRSPYTLPLFTPPESSFVIAFDLDTWSRFSDVTRSGKYLGNNTITLTLQNALALGLTNQQSGSNGYILQTFIVHDIRFSFQAGGSVVSYY